MNKICIALYTNLTDNPYTLFEQCQATDNILCGYNCMKINQHVGYTSNAGLHTATNLILIMDDDNYTTWRLTEQQPADFLHTTTIDVDEEHLLATITEESYDYLHQCLMLKKHEQDAESGKSHLAKAMALSAYRLLPPRSDEDAQAQERVLGITGPRSLH